MTDNVAVITTKNEASSILSVIGRLEPYADHVIVVDEESTDRTRELALDAGAEVHRWYGGIGPCLIEGWKWARQYRPANVIQIDAGGSHDPEDLDLLLASNADVVVGSRFVQGGVHTGPLWRRWGSQLYGAFWANNHGCAIRDWTSGYRVFSLDAINYLADCPYTATMHGWQAEVLSYAYRAGFDIEEVPIRYHAGRSSVSWKVIREAWKVAP